MSTFFSDVRDYTTLVEGQGAEQNFAFINEYLTYMEEPIRAHGGFIDATGATASWRCSQGRPNGRSPRRSAAWKRCSD
jgi:class 3 adenylate cyclase